jgi:hypothetical protein
MEFMPTDSQWKKYFGLGEDLPPTEEIDDNDYNDEELMEDSDPEFEDEDEEILEEDIDGNK